MNTLTVTKYRELVAEQNSWRLRSWFSPTARGIGLILFFTYLIIIPVQLHHDIIASVVVYCFGALMTLLGGLTLIWSLRIKRACHVTLGLPQSIERTDNELHSNETLNLSFSFMNIYLLPFFGFEATILFNGDDLQPLNILIQGNPRDHNAPVFIPVSFPHRGLWTIKSIQWKFGDQLGLWKFQGEFDALEITKGISIVAPLGYESGAPIINSCLRDGDSVPDVRDARGDYFDIKRYHPSDGLRKVVWKIFAKSGELLSRHPEKTMTPEGKVLMIVWADRFQDSACSLARSYCKLLEDSELDFSLVCRGIGDQAAVHSEKDAVALFTNTAWESSTESDDEIDFLISKLVGAAQSTSQLQTITHIVVISSLIETHSSSVDQIRKVAQKINEHGYIPAFIFAAPFERPHSEITTKPSFIKRMITGFFWTTENKPHSVRGDFSAFNREAASNRWEVYEVVA